MTRISSANDLARLDSVLELMDLPAFIIGVEDPQHFIIRKLNSAHVNGTGVSADALEGKRPHDVLPGRLADTICQNYRRCAETGKAISYEEMLDLSDGPRWWWTTLTPINDLSGQVVALLGTALDITEQKKREFDTMNQLARASRANTELQVFASVASLDVRGPLASMISLLDMIADGFMEMGDGKSQQVALCRDIGARAVERLDRLTSQSAKTMLKAMDKRELCLGHICADIMAAIDPDNRLDAEMPTDQVLCEPAATQLILHRLLENAAKHANHRIALRCTPEPGGMAIIVADDGTMRDDDHRICGRPVRPTLDGFGHDEALLNIIDLIEGRGGTITRSAPPAGFTAALKIHCPNMQPIGAETSKPAWPVCEVSSVATPIRQSVS